MEKQKLIRKEDYKYIMKEIISPGYIAYDKYQGLILNGIAISYDMVNYLIEEEQIEIIFESKEDRIQFEHLYTLFLAFKKRLKPEYVNKHIEKYKSLIVNF